MPKTWAIIVLLWLDFLSAVCRVGVEAITFDQLWSNYVSGNPYEDPSGTYANQCAIRLSATLHRVGIEMKSFSQKVVRPAAGKANLGRILLDGKPTATRADEMAAWLAMQPFCGLPQKPENITGKDWRTKIAGRTGIVAFSNYWRREGESAANASGGHIDLWNGARLTNNGVRGALTNFARFTLGINSGPGYSDLGNSTEILFWEIK